MNRANSPGPLPETYANALLLRDHGLEPAAIAKRLDVPYEAIGSLLRVAEAKLERALATGDDVERAPC